MPTTNQLVPDITNDGYFLTSSIDGSTETLTWAEIPSIPTNSPNFNEALSSSITDGKLLRVGQDSNNNKVIKYESDTNKLVPDITNDGYFLTSSIDGSTESLSWTNISIPVVDTSFNRFSTNACDSVALYDKIAQVSSDTYQEVLTQLQYTGGGLGAAAYLSANLGDFTNNVGFITTLPSNLPNFNETLSSSITDGKLLRVGQDSNNNKVIKYESDTNKLVPDITTDGYFLRSDIDGTTQSLTWAEIPSIPTNSPNFNEALSSSITDGKLLRVGQDSNNNKVIKYESDTNKLVPDITTDGYFLRSDIDGTTQSLTWAEIPSIPTNSPNFNETLTSSITDGKFLRVGTTGGNKVIKYETVNVIEDLTSYSQPGAISINTDSTLSLKQNSQTRIQIPDVGSANSAGRVDLKLGIFYASASSTGQGELRFTRADTDDVIYSRHHSIYTQHFNATSPQLNLMKFSIHNGTSAGTTQVDALTLNGLGNVGIGLVTPSEKLEVNGSIKCGSGTGKPMIGTLHANAWAAFANSVKFSDGNYALIQNDSGATRLNAVSGQYIAFSIQNSDKMRLISNGNFGIGVTSPSEKLEVSGTVKATDFKFPITGGGTFLVSSLYNNYATLELIVSNLAPIPNLTSFSQTEEISLTSTGNSIKLRTGGAATLATRLEVANNGNVTIGGNLSCGSYSGLPTGTGGTKGIVSVGDGLTVSNGNISTKPIRLLVAQFNSNASINLNSASRWITWDTTIYSNGIQHTSSTTAPNGSLFTVYETGVYHISVLLKVQGVGGRHGLVLDLYTMTGTNISVRPPSYDAIYGIANGYCRASQTSTRRVDLVGSVTLVIEEGQQFEIVGRCTYNTNTSAVNVISGSYVRVERMK